MKGKRNKKKNTVRKFLVRTAMLTILAAAAISPLHLGNAFLRSTDFDTVEVARKDSVWTIAARYTAKSEDAKELAEAIIEVNALSADGGLRVGQMLRVPIIKERLPKLAKR